MRLRDRLKLFRLLQHLEFRKVTHIDFVRPTRFVVRDIRQPFQLGLHVSQFLELRRRVIKKTET